MRAQHPVLVEGVVVVVSCPGTPDPQGFESWDPPSQPGPDLLLEIIVIHREIAGVRLFLLGKDKLEVSDKE